jgi:hypothetical protein
LKELDAGKKLEESCRIRGLPAVTPPSVCELIGQDFATPGTTTRIWQVKAGDDYLCLPKLIGQNLESSLARYQKHVFFAESDVESASTAKAKNSALQRLTQMRDKRVHHLVVINKSTGNLKPVKWLKKNVGTRPEGGFFVKVTRGIVVLKVNLRDLTLGAVNDSNPAKLRVVDFKAPEDSSLPQASDLPNADVEFLQGLSDVYVEGAHEDEGADDASQGSETSCFDDDYMAKHFQDQDLAVDHDYSAYVESAGDDPYLDLNDDSLLEDDDATDASEDEWLIIDGTTAHEDPVESAPTGKKKNFYTRQEWLDVKELLGEGMIPRDASIKTGVSFHKAACEWEGLVAGQSYSSSTGPPRMRLLKILEWIWEECAILSDLG